MAVYKHLPIFYRPTNVMLIDDDRKWLNILSDVIDPLFPYVMKQDPIEALYFLKTHTYDLQNLSTKLSQQTYDNTHASSLSTEKVSYHLKALRDQCHSPDPYKYIAVVFVDHQMEKMLGIEFCERVRELNLPVQLVLLTGKASLQEGVNALNEGAIDAYVSKGEFDKADSKHIKKKINETLEKLAWKQFQQMSQELLGSIVANSSVLVDKHFKEIFKTILDQYNICEFYMVDMTGSFFLISPQGKVYFLMVRSLSDFETLYELAKDSKAPDGVIQAIRDKQQFPFVAIKEVFPILKGRQWEDFMQPVAKLPGQDIFYVVLDYSGLLDVFSFNKYVNEVWPSP